MYKGRHDSIVLCALIIFIVIGMGFSLVHAQYWAALPPYNVLWPLWSDILSPIDPVTGLATPLVNAITRNTILPIQPVMAWDPVQPSGAGIPWLLYNTPAALGNQLLFYDVFYGLNQWPPSYLVDSATGVPNPIALPLGWSLLLPTDLKNLQWYLPLANTYYSNIYGVPLTSLLTAVDIWGLTPLALLPPSVF
ncbi:MAG: hypothetical protein ACMUIL_07455 [bacterium]